MDFSDLFAVTPEIVRFVYNSDFRVLTKYKLLFIKDLVFRMLILGLVEL